MTGHSPSRHSMTLGPFLTLLVLTAFRRRHVGRERLAAAQTAPVDIPSDWAEQTEDSSRRRSQAATLGPFFTLILTLHLRDGGAWQPSGSCRQSTPFVRLHPSA